MADVGILLVQHITKCYLLTNIPKSPPDRILEPLRHRTLVLSDIDLRPDDFSPISRFLSSKQALSWLECIVLNKTSLTSKRSRRVALFKNGNYSGLNLEGCRMLRAINEFVTRSMKLQRLEIDSINISPVLISSLGVALTNHRGLKFLTLKNVPLGDEGLRLLTPHLSKCKIQCLTLNKCHLTDGSLPFLTSIIKSQEAIQENNFWNSTLRSYPTSLNHSEVLSNSQRQAPQVDQSVHRNSQTNTGLVLIDLSDNKLTTKGGFLIAHLLAENKWILGINLCCNRIEERGIDRLLRDLVSPDRLECAVICVHLSGNPGCDESVREILSHTAVGNLRHPIFSTLRTQNNIIQLLLQWINEQKEQKNLDKYPRKRMGNVKNQPRIGESEREDQYNEPVLSDEIIGGEDDEREEDEEDGKRRYHEELKGIQRHLGSHNLSLSDHVLNAQSEDLNLQSDSGHGHSPRESNAINQQQKQEKNGRNSQDQNKNYLEDFGFEGYSPTHREGSDDIDGRPPSRNGIRPRTTHSSSRPPSRQGGERDHADQPHLSESFQADYRPRSSSRTKSLNLPHHYRSFDDQDLQLHSRGRNEILAKRSVSRLRSRSADGISFRRPVEHQNYMNPTISSNSYRQSILNDFLLTTMVDGFHQTPDRDPLQHPSHSTNLPVRSVGNKRESQPHSKTRGRPTRKTAPYPQSFHTSPARRTRRVWSPPPKNRHSDKHDPNPRMNQSEPEIGREKPRKKTKKLKKKKSEKDAEVFIQQLGQGVMNELTKVVDTVSTDLRLVSEQLRNLSTSMTESMLVSSFSKDPDSSILQNINPKVDGNLKKVAKPEKKSRGRNSPERNRETRYDQISSDQESHDQGDIEIKDEDLTQLIRENLKKKLLTEVAIRQK